MSTNVAQAHGGDERHENSSILQPTPPGRAPQVGTPTNGQKPYPPEEWNATARDFSQVCLHELFAAQARRTPDSVAVADEKKRLTYGELNARANQVGRHLRKLGVGPEVLVGVAVERTAELLVALLGILKAGGAYVPLDPECPPDRLAFMVRDSGLRLLVTQEFLKCRWPGIGPERVYLDAHRELISQESTEDFPSGAGPDNLVYVIYTSGSTGVSKGVLTTHRSLVNLLESVRWRPGFTAHDTFLATNTVSFDMSKPELFLPLIVGGRVFVARRGIAYDLKQFEECLAMSGATVLQGTPSFWRLLIESGWQGGQHLKIWYGGETTPEGLTKELLKRCSSLWHMYGPTETTIYATTFPVTAADGAIPIGTPMANYHAFILDDHLLPMPLGEAGQLHIGGVGLARGYLNRPELTAEKFIPNPFTNQPGSRLYKTGDLARFRPDGNIEFLGRVDSQVKIRGFRVETGEVETLLAEHPGIEAAAVVAREDAPGEKRIVAYVVSRAGHSLVAQELRRFLKRKLPDYMLPARFEFLRELPLTPSDKVDRRALPPPGSSRQVLADAQQAPRTELEDELARIFAEVLGLDWVGIDEDFFDAGGDSLRALRLLSMVEERVGRKISLSDLFEAPCVGKLAALLSDPHSRVGLLCALAVQPRGSRPAFFCVEGGPQTRALALKLGPDQPFLGLVFDEAKKQSLPMPYKVEDMAAILVRKLREAQPEGPYFLGSWCWGGLVAYEMAQQLWAQGEEVRLLVLIDPLPPSHAPKPAKSQGLGVRLSRLRRRVSAYTAHLRGQEWRHFLGRSKQKLERLKLNAEYVIYRRRLRLGLPIPARMQKWKYATWFSKFDYRPQPYPGNVALIRGETPGLVPDGDDLGWADLVRGRLQVRFLPFSLNYEVFREPKVTPVAHVLDELLEAAQ